MPKKAAPEKAPVAPVPSVDSNAPLKIDAIEEKEESEPQEKSNKRLFVLGAGVLGLIIIGVLGFIFLFIQNPPEGKSMVKTVTQGFVQASPSAALPVLVRSEWTFEVLNGAGVAGAAKKAADKLSALGYKVLETGNADRQTYTGNSLFVSKEMESKVDLVIADLKDTIKIASVAGVLKDSSASARIIIGKE